MNTYEKSVPHTSHILLYAVRRVGDEGCIVILDIVHSRRDWPPGEMPPS